MKKKLALSRGLKCVPNILGTRYFDISISINSWYNDGIYQIFILKELSITIDMHFLFALAFSIQMVVGRI